MRLVELPALPSFSGVQQMPSPPGAALMNHSMSAFMGRAGSYTPLGQNVTQEVHQFIEQGQQSSAMATSAQGNWLALQAARQLLQERKTERSASTAVTGTSSADAEATTSTDGAPSRPLRPEQQAFLDRIGPWASKAAAQLGVSVRSVMAHAALESGWGQRPLKTADGSDALNLFGIKATGGWQGARTQSSTTEYVDGVPQQQVQPFRQYSSLDSTFDDYVSLLGRNPRYRQALGTGSDVHAFAQGLVAGGYATDPHYADKLVRVSRSIPSPL